MVSFRISAPKIGFSLTVPEAGFVIKDHVIIEPDAYTGEYVVDPDFTGTVLQTSGKKMLDDVTVNAIEVARVSNPSGGKTVYIGGILNG